MPKTKLDSRQPCPPKPKPRSLYYCNKSSGNLCNTRSSSSSTLSNVESRSVNLTKSNRSRKSPAPKPQISISKFETNKLDKKTLAQKKSGLKLDLKPIYESNYNIYDKKSARKANHPLRAHKNERHANLQDDYEKYLENMNKMNVLNSSDTIKSEEGIKNIWGVKLKPIEQDESDSFVYKFSSAKNSSEINNKHDPPKVAVVKPNINFVNQSSKAVSIVSTDNQNYLSNKRSKQKLTQSTNLISTSSSHHPRQSNNTSSTPLLNLSINRTNKENESFAPISSPKLNHIGNSRPLEFINKHKSSPMYEMNKIDNSKVDFVDFQNELLNLFNNSNNRGNDIKAPKLRKVKTREPKTVKELFSDCKFDSLTKKSSNKENEPMLDSAIKLNTDYNHTNQDLVKPPPRKKNSIKKFSNSYSSSQEEKRKILINHRLESEEFDEVLCKVLMFPGNDKQDKPIRKDKINTRRNTFSVSPHQSVDNSNKDSALSIEPFNQNDSTRFSTRSLNDHVENYNYGSFLNKDFSLKRSNSKLVFLAQI